MAFWNTNSQNGQILKLCWRFDWRWSFLATGGRKRVDIAITIKVYFDENGIKNNIFLHKIILYKITYKMLFYSLHPSNKITAW